MMKKFFIILALTISHAMAEPRLEAQKILASISMERNLAKRLDLVSRPFVGLPYGVGGPLGEGASGQYDQDPLYRFDTFDCTTFVETVISLARTQDVDNFEREMNEIRYDNAQVDYLTRNHFTDLQWIPLNVKNGILSEINDQVLPANEQRMAQAEINLPGWLRSIKLAEIRVPSATIEERQQLLKELQAQSRNYTSVLAQLNYIAISTILKKPNLIKKIPHASIVNFVRPNWDLTQEAGTHQNISHQGLLFWKGRSLYLRHASSAGSVREDLFMDYLKKFENHPTLKGIHLMKVN